jgi:pyruvate/2-oxoglutarate dehydrogenase complex dihydrolipoamide dehydrogenase (E3) component
MGRASLADPHMPNKAKDGDFEEIIKCIGCLQGCSGRNSKQLPVKCLVNPMTGNESIYDLGKSVLRKKVLIAGGGIAGMEAAIVAAKRGHYVHLFEKSNLLGGQWLIASVPPYKEELSSLINWQKHQLTQLGVKVYLNKTLTRDIVDFEKPDGVIIATGSEAKKLNFMSIRGDLVISANRILSGEVETGQNILVIGGGSIGVETAVYLAAHDKKVTIIEAGDDLMRDGESVVNHYLFKELIKFDIQVLKNAHVKTISENKVVTYDIDGNMKRMKNIDTIISAIGSMSVNNLSKELKNIEADVIIVGDALKVRKGLEAVDEGFKAGLLI